MRTLQLYGSAAASANSVATVTVPSAGTIKAVSYAVNVDQVADNSICILELSKAPAAQIGVNGAQDPFFELRTYFNLVTSGVGMTHFNGQQKLNVTCRQGEIIYLHCQIATSTFYANFIFWY